MTEEEARKKWCPMVRFHVVDDSVEDNKNRYKDSESVLCIASDCMMWRGNVIGTHPTERDEKGNYLEVLDGYCGLGGKP